MQASCYIWLQGSLAKKNNINQQYILLLRYHHLRSGSHQEKELIFLLGQNNPPITTSKTNKGAALCIYIDPQCKLLSVNCLFWNTLDRCT